MLKILGKCTNNIKLSNQYAVCNRLRAKRSQKKERPKKKAWLEEGGGGGRGFGFGGRRISR